MEFETHPPNCYGKGWTDVATTRVRLPVRKQTHLHISPSGRRRGRRRRQDRVCQRVMEEAQEGGGREITNKKRGERAFALQGEEPNK